MSNKEWDKISYNQSREVNIQRASKELEKLLKERPPEPCTYEKKETVVNKN